MRECQDNQDLLNTLYSSVSSISTENNQPDQTKKTKEQPNFALSKTAKNKANVSPSDRDNYADYSISIDDIKQTLPNAEKIYQQLVANYLEEYKTYQNYIIDGLDLVWYAVAFIAFGRSSYRKMGFKYHPDLDGSEMAMQLINTAWSISQDYLKKSAAEDNML